MVGQISKLQSPILNIKTSLPNILVLHTFPGHAKLAHIVIDEKFPLKILIPQKMATLFCGTIAGDDTVLVLSTWYFFYRVFTKIKSFKLKLIFNLKNDIIKQFFARYLS